MVFAKEVKINIKEGMDSRIQQLRKERELAKKNIESKQIYNYIRDNIVKGIIFNKHVVRYIRNKDQQEKQELEQL